MTNAKYHRCRKALQRLEASAMRVLERDRLRSIVGEYQRGGLRAKNGRGSGAHSSHAEA